MARSCIHEEKTSPLVSVLIPAYYSGDKLFRSLASVLKQDYKRLEIIVSDDGTAGFSTVECEMWLRQEKPDVSCRVIHHDENKGTVCNLNAALHIANGQWVMPLAADDVLYTKTAVSHLLENAAAEGRTWAIAISAINDKGTPKPGTNVPDSEILNLLKQGDQKELYWRLCFDCCLSASGAMYRRDVLEALGGFDTNYRLVEDWPLMLRLIRSGFIPSVASRCLVLREETGVSGKKASRHVAYQRDLIRVMEQEILPNIPGDDEKRARMLLTQIEDKRVVFRMRYQCGNWIEKGLCLGLNPGVLWRKIKMRIKV